MTRKLRWLVPFLALVATMVAGTAGAAAAPTVQLDGVRTTRWTVPATTVSILRLDLTKASVAEPPPCVRVGTVGAYLTSTVAGALNSALGVSFFAPASSWARRTPTRTSPGNPYVYLTSPALSGIGPGTRLRPAVDIAAAPTSRSQTPPVEWRMYAIAPNLPFHSLCEHHLLPFHGVATSPASGSSDSPSWPA